VVIRALLLEASGTGKELALTRIDILLKEATPYAPEALDYGSILFVRQTLSRDASLDRLRLLTERRFQIAQYALISSGKGSRTTINIATTHIAFGRVPYFRFVSVPLDFDTLNWPTNDHLNWPTY
jgi:hypothetical protein